MESELWTDLSKRDKWIYYSKVSSSSGERNLKKIENDAEPEGVKKFTPNDLIGQRFATVDKKVLHELFPRFGNPLRNEQVERREGMLNPERTPRMCDCNGIRARKNIMENRGVSGYIGLLTNTGIFAYIAIEPTRTSDFLLYSSNLMKPHFFAYIVRT